jgi:septum formation protein
MKVILASKSPRRREILGTVLNEFNIEVAECDESLPSSVHPREGVRELAERKGEATYNKLISLGEDLSDALIISSDTLVERDGEHLGKPTDKNDAFLMLKKLSGRAHNVHTGVALRLGERTVSGTATTAVVFRDMTDNEIWDYIATGEPMDKAGSYGIQGIGGKFVTGYDGDYDTVVGFSLKLFFELLEKMGISYSDIGGK